MFALNINTTQILKSITIQFTYNAGKHLEEALTIQLIGLISEGRVEIEQSFSNLHTAKMSRENKLEKPVKISVL